MPVPNPAPKLQMPNIPFKLIGIVVGVLLVLGVGFVVASSLLNRTSIPTTTQEARAISLNYWGMTEDSAVFKSVLKQFEADHPGVSIQYSVQSPKDYSERLVSACNRGQCPDLFRFHSTWTNFYMLKGLLATVPSSVMSTSQFEQTFYPVVSNDLKTSTGYAGLPIMYDGLGLYVNKKILQASGKSVPTTWDELRSLGRELTIRGADGSIQRSGVAMGTANNVDHFSDILAVLIAQNGGNILKPETTSSAQQTINSGSGTPQASLVADALTFYTQFVREDKVWDETMPNSTYAFAIERTAMIIAPTFRAAEIKKINPNFEFAVYPIPQLPGKPVTLANYWVEGVSKASKEQPMAWELLKYLSSADVQKKLYAPGGGKLLREVSPRVDLSPQLISDPFAGAIVSQAPNSRSTFLSSRTFDKALNDKLIELYTNVITQMAKGGRYEELGPKFAPLVLQLAQSYGLAIK